MLYSPRVGSLKSLHWGGKLKLGQVSSLPRPPTRSDCLYCPGHPLSLVFLWPHALAPSGPMVHTTIPSRLFINVLLLLFPVETGLAVQLCTLLSNLWPACFHLPCVREEGMHLCALLKSCSFFQDTLVLFALLGCFETGFL